MNKFISFLKEAVSGFESNDRCNELYIEIDLDDVFSKNKLANIILALIPILVIPLINVFISFLIIPIGSVRYVIYTIFSIILIINNIYDKFTIKKRISKMFTQWEIEVRKNTPDIKMALDKDIILQENKNFKDFIYNFFVRYNYEYSTLRIDGSLYCRTNRRRSLGDIYLICNYYFPNTKMEDVFLYIHELAEGKLPLNASRCGEIHKIVFYRSEYSYWRNSDQVEYSNYPITLGKVLKYYNR